MSTRFHRVWKRLSDVAVVVVVGSCVPAVHSQDVTGQPAVNPEAIAQSPQRPAVRQAAEAFGFWAGEWDLEWTGGAGTNTIAPILGGAVMHENFVDPTGYEGQSLTTWDAKTQQWRQVWVDNAGAYLEFSGKMDDGERIMTLDNNPTPGAITRMRWHDVAEDSFTWTYETQPAPDAPWKTNWRIQYTRRAADGS